MKRSCENIQKLIIEAESGDSLTADLYRAIEEHVAGCPSCQAFQRDVVLLLNGLKGRPLPSLSEGFFEEIRENVLTAATRYKTRRPTFWWRIRERIQNFFSWRPVLAPLATGILGILIGIIGATAWMHPASRISQPRLALKQNISQTRDSGAQIPPSPVVDAVPSPVEIEEYIGTENVLDFLENQEAQAFLSYWSKELPESLLGPPSSETG